MKKVKKIVRKKKPIKKPVKLLPKSKRRPFVCPGI